jgi:CheY-like chemotaxis protein
MKGFFVLFFSYLSIKVTLLKKANVCIIDDDPIQIFLMKKYLQKSGMVNQIIDFQNGKIAFDFFNHKSFPKIDIIFLDINMPVWDGWEFLKEFSKLPIYESTQVFLLTSSQSPFDREQANVFKLDNSYFLKPITFQSVLKILQFYIDNSSKTL